MLSRFLRENHIENEIIIFCDHDIEVSDADFVIVNDGGKTKYHRILALLRMASYEQIVCIDNDIKPNDREILAFLLSCMSGDYIAGWGKIYSQLPQGILPRLIQVDKTLSHEMIRPFLWKMGVGISMPGQVFMIHRDELKKRLPKVHTSFDDLQIGLVIKKSGFPINYTDSVLGWEKPKETWRGIIQQRIRWARGYSQTILNNRGDIYSLGLILLHGFFYHGLLVGFWILFLFLCIGYQSLWYSSVLLFAVLIALSRKRISQVSASVVYLLIFPLLHVIWLIFVCLNVLRYFLTIQQPISKE